MRKGNPQQIIYDNASRLQYVKNFYGSKKAKMKKEHADKTKERKKQKRIRNKQLKRDLIKNFNL